MTKLPFSKQKTQRGFALVAATGIALVVATAAMARQGVVAFPLYRGGAGSVDLGSWGSGSAAETEKPVLIGTRSIRITTQGLYQGGRIAFKAPVDLAPAFASPKTYLRMQMRFDNAQVSQRNFRDPFAQRTQTAPFARMRFVLTMADGTRYELIRPLVIPATEDPDSYVPISFPIKAILKKGDGTAFPVPTGDGAKIKEIAVFGDKYNQFTIGEMEVITDDTEISVAPLDEPIVYVNDQITFSGSAEGGASTLHYSWDFDSSDGIQEDAVGRTVTHVFRNGGKVTVTLTVTDEDGIKPKDQKSVTFEVTGDQ